MQRNPDVTVRSRGVMEKCTYCVQRINSARIQSKREDREIRDGEVVTACESACPSQAITFGNLNDPSSRVAKLKADPRNYSTAGRAEHAAAHDLPRGGAESQPRAAVEPDRGRSRHPRHGLDRERALMAQHVHSQQSATTLDAPVIGPGQDYETITVAVSEIPLGKRYPVGWIIGLLIGLTGLGALQLAIGYLVVKGVYIWGNNVPVGWAFDIINFVWWIGIGHAGTLISAILLLLQAAVAHVDQPLRRSDDDLRGGLRGALPAAPHRPAVAGRLLAVPVSRTPWACGRSSAARSSGTCSPSRPTPPCRSSSGSSA